MGRDHGDERGGEHVTDDADEADAADRQQRQVEHVGAGVVGQVGAGQHPAGRAQVVLGVLDRDDPRVLGEPDQRLGRDRDPGAAGDVVEHHRQAGRVGDGGEVAEQARLRWLGVVGRDDQQAAAPAFSAAWASSTVCAVSLVPTPATTWARSPTASTTARSSRVLLLVGGGRRLARGAVDDEAVVAVVDEVGRQPLGAVEVERAVGGERRDHGGEHAAEGRLGSRTLGGHGATVPVTATSLSRMCR